MGLLWPVDRRVTPGVILLGKAIYVVGSTGLAKVQWSQFPGGHQDNTPPCGTQVVGPIEYEGVCAEVGPVRFRRQRCTSTPRTTQGTDLELVRL